uniref:Ig-like domain-containing protein n=1 Tax=Sus scrofa TaxID=9823 RepID=A0A8D0SNM2_PIG
MTCEASQNPQAGNFVKAASLSKGQHNVPWKKKGTYLVIPHPQSNLGSSSLVIRLLLVGSRPERSSLSLCCPTTISVFTLMLELLLFLLSVRGMDVDQSPPALSLQEGVSSTLWCNFSSSTRSVQWYRLAPGGHLSHLFTIPAGTQKNGRLNATTVATERRSSLYISSAQTTDSATYLCAGEHSAPQAPAACTGTLRGAQPLLQPPPHHEAPTGHSHGFLFLTYTGTHLTTDTFWPTDLGLRPLSSLLNLYLLLH